MYSSETMVWKVKDLHMGNRRGLLGIGRMDKVPNTRVKELCRVSIGVDERIDEGVLRWFSFVERRRNDNIATRVYVRECTRGPSVGRPRKKWIDTVKDCLKKSGLGVRQARRKVYERREWRGLRGGNA